MMELTSKPGYEKTLNRFEAWWNCQIIDRPPVCMSVPSGKSVPWPQKQHASQRERWFDLDFRIDEFSPSAFDLTATAAAFASDSPAQKRRLHQGAPERIAGWWCKGCQLREDRGQSRVFVTVDQEVVAHREQHVHVGFNSETPEEVREARLYIRSAECEQLLELVHDDQGVVVFRAPATDHGEGLLGILDLQELIDGLLVGRQLRRERTRQRHEWCRPIQVPSEGVVPSDDHCAADGPSWLDSSPGIALSGRQRERSDEGGGENIHGGFGQAIGRDPVRRAA